MNDNHQHNSDAILWDAYHAIVGHRKKAIGLFLFIMTVTVLVTLLTPRAYRSESKLFLRLGRENAMLDSTATFGNDAVVAVPPSRENEINSVAEMLASRATLEQVVDRLGPEIILEGPAETQAAVTAEEPGFTRWLGAVRDQCSQATASLRSLLATSQLSPRDQAIERLGKKLEVNPAPKTNVICVSYEVADPELAQTVVASLVNTYLEQHVRLNRTHGTHDFFAQHTKRLQNELKDLENELVELKTTTGLASVDEQRTQLVARIGRLEDELLTTQAARAEAEARVDSLTAKLASLPKEQVLETSTGIGNAGTDMIRDKFFALQVQEKEAATIYTSGHPKLKMLREELAEAEGILALQERTRTEVKTAPDATYEQTRLALTTAEPELAALSAKTQSLESQLSRLHDSLAALNTNGNQIARLTRETELRETEYRKYAMNLEQALIDEAMEAERMSNISVAQPASLERLAVRPRKKLNLLLGLVLATAGAMGLPLLIENLKRSASA